MKPHNRILMFILMATLSLCAMVGCATKNPQFNAAAPPSATNQPYVPNAFISGPVSNGIATGQQINQAVPTPYQGVIADGLSVLGFTLAGIAGMVARSKNNAAIAAQATAQHLANNIPSTAVQSVIEAAATPELAASVAKVLQTAT